MNTATQGIKILGINSDADTCACCGKSGLKRVVWLQFGEGSPTHYGTQCAATACGLDGKYSAGTADKMTADFNKKNKQIEAKNKAISDAQKEADRLNVCVTVYVDNGVYCFMRSEIVEKRMIYGYTKKLSPSN